jgi:hypothetical protein
MAAGGDARTPWSHRLDRWLYRGGRPSSLAKLLNRLTAAQYAAGVMTFGRGVTLEVRGRRSGKTVAFPLVLTRYEGERYLVSMLGGETNWVRNVRAAGGRAMLRRRGRERVVLEEVDPSLRAPILKRYLALAPGARAHIPVDRDASPEEFERIAGQFPVFRITAAR